MENQLLIDIGPSAGQSFPESECINIDGQNALKSECVFCVDCDEWALTENAQQVAIDASGTLGWVSENAEYVYCGYLRRGGMATFYSEDYCYSDCDDVYFFNGDVAEYRGWYYYESVDDYRQSDPEEDEYEDNSMYRFSYHSGNRHSYLSGQSFGIGFEVEKEDEDAMRKESAADLWHRTKWAKESDGSLDCDSGYELVSPVFPLYEHDFKKEFKKVDYLLDAEYSKSCGGHINLSMASKSNKELLDSLIGWLPLFYGMYPGRIRATYCAAKKKENYGDGEKYSAIYLKGSKIVEFRIVSAVRDSDNLMWRTELFKIMCSNLDLSELQVLRMLLDTKSQLHKHITVIYKGEKLMKLIRNFVKFSDDFNDAKMPSLTEERIKKFEENFIKEKGDKK